MTSGEGGQPWFDRAAVLGIGLIGASFALAVRRAGLVGEIVGVARRESTREVAERVGAADWTTPNPREAARAADLVYLAPPVGVLGPMLESIADGLREGCLVTDAGSVKGPVCAAAERVLPPSVAFVGGHPMAGAERSGPEAADADLFAGHTYFLVATARGGNEAVARLARVVGAIGARPAMLAAEEHDRILAATSHLPHALASSLALAVARLVPDAEARARFSAGGLRDTTRIAASPPELWRDIFLANAEALAGACRVTIELLEELVRAAEEGDAEGLVEMLSRAQTTRLGLQSEAAEEREG